jgi:hypothetical protein
MKTTSVKTWKQSPAKEIFSPSFLEPEVVEEMSPPAPWRERQVMSEVTKIQ